MNIKKTLLTVAVAPIVIPVAAVYATAFYVSAAVTVSRQLKNLKSDD